MKIVLLSLVVLLSIPVVAQTRKKSAPLKQVPRTLVDTIKTSDREVRLYSDNTYEITKLELPSEIKVDIEIAVIKADGNVVPGAQTPLIIFGEDISSDISKIPYNQSSLDLFSGIYLFTKYKYNNFMMTGYREMDESLKKEISTSIETKSKFSFRTDLSGKYTISLPKGDTPYFLYSHYTLGSSKNSSTCVWYMKVIPNKDQKITLANDQAVACH